MSTIDSTWSWWLLGGAPTHPGADFDVTDEERRPLFVVTDGAPLAEADCIDVPIVGEVDADGVVRWAGRKS